MEETKPTREEIVKVIIQYLLANKVRSFTFWAVSEEGNQFRSTAVVKSDLVELFHFFDDSQEIIRERLVELD